MIGLVSLFESDESLPLNESTLDDHSGCDCDCYGKECDCDRSCEDR